MADALNPQPFILDEAHTMAVPTWQDAYPSVTLPWANDGYPAATQWCQDNNIPLLDVLPTSRPSGWKYYFRTSEGAEAFREEWA